MTAELLSGETEKTGEEEDSVGHGVCGEEAKENLVVVRRVEAWGLRR